MSWRASYLGCPANEFQQVATSMISMIYTTGEDDVGVVHGLDDQS